MQMASTKNPRSDGKQLEQRVHALLSLKGVHNLSREKQFASKKVDLYFETTLFGARRRYGVECKDYTDVLTQSDLSSIHFTYAAAFRANDITDLLIISNGQLAPSAQSYIDSIPQLSHMSIAELRNSLIDLRGYLGGLKTRFLAEDVLKYYVESHGYRRDPKTGAITQTPNDTDKNLIALVHRHFAQPSLPLVVLGEYGLGKTTLAKQLFLSLLATWESDPASPIPIYISLDRMMREQSLEGLLGTIFTSVAPSEGYNFDLFRSLSDLGHLALIFDGIDEMRHKLSWEEFEYNLDQLALLTARNSRSILLGRPTAFMDQREYEAALYARPLHRPTFEIRSRVRYQEIFIDPFTQNQIELFVTKFCAWKYQGQPQLTKRILTLLAKRENARINDITKRPVQLMMFLEIFPQLPQKLDKITQVGIYSLFIDELIRREKEKPVRHTFTHTQHRLFGQRVAWWLWLRGGNTRIEARQIGDDVLQEFVNPGEDIDVVRRSLVTASFLTTQGGTFLRFPHRSIQEFFVAEYLATRLRAPGTLFEMFQLSKLRLSEVFTPEIVEFLAAQISLLEVQEFVFFLSSAGKHTTKLLELNCRR
jgi:NACHT domain/Restriction endonuclease